MDLEGHAKEAACTSQFPKASQHTDAIALPQTHRITISGIEAKINIFEMFHDLFSEDISGLQIFAEEC